MIRSKAMTCSLLLAVVVAGCGSGDTTDNISDVPIVDTWELPEGSDRAAAEPGSDNAPLSPYDIISVADQVIQREYDLDFEGYRWESVDTAGIRLLVLTVFRLQDDIDEIREQLGRVEQQLARLTGGPNTG